MCYVTLMYLYILINSCISRINATWLQCMILLLYCWIHFVNILLKILTFMFMRDCCCCSSVSKSCLTLCDPMIAPNFFVPHHLLEFTQVHVHWISDANQPSHPLSPLFPPAFNLSQHIRLLSNELALPIKGSQSIGASASASVCPMNIQGCFLRTDWLDLLAVQGTLKSLLQHHSSKDQFFGVQPSLRSSSHICTWLLEKPCFKYTDLCW